MTRRKEEEPSSSSIFNQNDPWTPSVDFSNFISNETIAGEVSCQWDKPRWGYKDELYLLTGGSLETI